MTSRPDLPLRVGFNAVEGTYQVLILHQMPQRIVEEDITLFIKHELKIIRNKFNSVVEKSRQLRASWPNGSDRRLIVKATTPLFITADTACRYIRDRKFGNPEKRLVKLWDNVNAELGPEQDAVYIPVPNQKIEGMTPTQKQLPSENLN